MTADRPDDLRAMYAEKYAASLRELGRVNLAVFGKTGTGKSTLINAIFGRQVAATGTGRPVTTGLEYFEHPDGILGIYDSQGFETGQSGDAVLATLDGIVTTSRTRPLPEQIHVAWYTVRWSDRRFEAGQEAFVRRLVGLALPVVFVLTQVPMNAHGQVHTDALALARHVESLGLPISPRNHVFLTNALADDFLGSPVHGLQELLDATFETAPEAVALALTAAQQIDLERKRQAARRVITGATGAAMATGATPIPFSDAALLIPIQIAMIARISAAFGLTLPADRTAGLVGSLMLTSGATTGGRWLVSNLLRVIPGGQPVAMVISGSVAAALTSAMGWAWVAVCERVLLRDPDGVASLLDTEGLGEFFTEEFRRRLRFRRDGTPEVASG